MKTTLGVLAIVVLVTLTGATCTLNDVEEYSEDAYKRILRLLHAAPEVLKAHFFNADHQLVLHGWDLDEDTFLMTSKSAPQQENAYTLEEWRNRAHYVNIKTDPEVHYYVIHRFGFKVSRCVYTSKIRVEILVLMKVPWRPSGLSFTVPVFKKPTYLIESGHDHESYIWTDTAKLKSSFPITPQQIINYRYGYPHRPLSVTFEWLSELLELDVYKAGFFDPAMDVFITHPLLLPNDAIDAILKVNPLKDDIEDQEE